MIDNEQPKWTEIEHLPEWDEEFYDVYTAKNMQFGRNETAISMLLRCKMNSFAK